MCRSIITVLTLVLVIGSASQASAVWVDGVHRGYGFYGPDSFVRYVRNGYCANDQWPWPYLCPDRAAVREPFAMMVDNGWRRQNLLGPHHFDATKGTLTTAGELKVHWIMTQAPPERRSIFVERSLDASVTAERVEAARDYAARVAADGRTPQVGDTHLVSEGRPAAAVDAVYTRFNESMKPPVLPAPSASSSLTQ
jgi:hypothetical protein